jgi:hypothetical protein
VENFAMVEVTRYDFGVTFLPIADRELRVSARSKATHRLRILFAVRALLLTDGAIWPPPDFEKIIRSPV